MAVAVPGYPNEFFVGTEVSVYGTVPAGPIGAVNSAYSLDGQPPFQFSSPTVTSTFIFNVTYLQAVSLVDGPHTLNITFTGGGYNNGTFFIDYIRYTGTSSTSTLSSTSVSSSVPTQTTTQTSTTKKTNVGAIAGGVVGGVLVLLAVIGLLLCYQRRHRRHLKAKYHKPPTSELPSIPTIIPYYDQHSNLTAQREDMSSPSTPTWVPPPRPRNGKQRPLESVSTNARSHSQQSSGDFGAWSSRLPAESLTVYNDGVDRQQQNGYFPQTSQQVDGYDLPPAYDSTVR